MHSSQYLHAVWARWNYTWHRGPASPVARQRSDTSRCRGRHDDIPHHPIQIPMLQGDWNKINLLNQLLTYFWFSFILAVFRAVINASVCSERTWDSRSSTWKLVLEDPWGQGLSSRTQHCCTVRSTWTWTWLAGAQWQISHPFVTQSLEDYGAWCFACYVSILNPQNFEDLNFQGHGKGLENWSSRTRTFLEDNNIGCNSVIAIYRLTAVVWLVLQLVTFATRSTVASFAATYRYTRMYVKHRPQYLSNICFSSLFELVSV